jgi:hypothetical protein
MFLDDVACPWPVDAESCALADVDETDTVFTASVSTASSILTRLSGYTVGLCETEIRPLDICPTCRTWCCGGSDSIRLKSSWGLPVWDVMQVRLGPDAYEPATWRFDREGGILWRVPPDRWPQKDEKWSAPGEGDAFVVDAVIGTPPDAWAMDVAARLTKELYLSCKGSKCRLPSNVTNVTSQGITIRLRDNEINTFIPEVGAWLAAVNPHKARLPSVVMSPDISGARNGCLRARGVPGGR